MSSPPPSSAARVWIRWQRFGAWARCLARCSFKMISTGIVILGIDQNYSQIIIGAVVIIAVVLDQINNWLARRRLTKAG